MRSVFVKLPERHYEIRIGENLLSRSDFLLPLIKANQVCIVTNDNVASLYLDSLKAMLSQFQVDVVVLPDGEQFKNLDTVNQVFDTLLSSHHHRTTTLIAVGGGVIGDMTGFAAAS